MNNNMAVLLALTTSEWIDVVLALATFGLALGTFQMARAAKRQAKATSRLVRIAKKELEVNSEPRIQLTRDGIEPWMAGGKDTIAIGLENSGPGGAKIEKVDLELVIDHNDFGEIVRETQHIARPVQHAGVGTVLRAQDGMKHVEFQITAQGFEELGREPIKPVLAVEYRAAGSGRRYRYIAELDVLALEPMRSEFLSERTIELG